MLQIGFLIFNIFCQICSNNTSESVSNDSELYCVANIPVVSVSRTHFTSKEEEQTSKIVHEQILVERAVEWLKPFKILSRTISVASLGTIETNDLTFCSAFLNRNEVVLFLHVFFEGNCKWVFLVGSDPYLKTQIRTDSRGLKTLRNCNP